jgi:hypothetical protein
MMQFVKEPLRDLVTTRPDLCQSPQRCEEWLLQHCPRFPREVRLLRRALDKGVVADLLDADPTMSWPGVEDRLVQRLVDEAGLTPREARDAVQTWGEALGRFTGSDVPAISFLSTEEPPIDPATQDTGVLPTGVWHMIIAASVGGVGALLAPLLLPLSLPLWVVVGASLVAAIGGGIGGAVGWIIGGGQSSTYISFGGAWITTLVRGLLGAFQGGAGGASVGLLAGYVLTESVLTAMSGAGLGAFVGAGLGTYIGCLIGEWWGRLFSGQ